MDNYWTNLQGESEGGSKRLLPQPPEKSDGPSRIISVINFNCTGDTKGFEGSGAP